LGGGQATQMTHLNLSGLQVSVSVCVC